MVITATQLLDEADAIAIAEAQALLDTLSL